ncbi:MAG: hypothetical protein V4674_00295 [Patescibacteria group bacterium]
MLKKLALVFGVAVLALLLVGGYYGVVPVLSTVLGANSPDHMGAMPTDQEFTSAKTKLGLTIKEQKEDTPIRTSLRFSGKSNINASFTANELSALLRNDLWRYNFIREGSVRINEDGTAEVTGQMLVSRLPGYAEAHGISLAAIKQYLDPMISLGLTPAFRVKVDAEWKNNKLTMEIQEITVGRYQVPEEWLSENKQPIEQFVQTMVLAVPGVSIQTLDFKGGKMNAVGSFPSEISWAVEGVR